MTDLTHEELLRAALDDEKAGRRVAGEAADRFRDVVTEILGLDDNPGDDELISQLRALHGKTGPEPRRWRDFITGAVAHVERNGRRWLSDAALNEGGNR
ncbi:hypothetical protein [Micromonospora sp. NPDC048169]|uniref:hypothetical protein n=1 Tax=Micromonospora sp. NPDC048169 TaxID=3154711 RepID=UPI00340E484B